MGSGAKKVVAIAAAVAVPYVAPMVATALGTSAVVSGAIAGAGLQAASAAITGGDVGKSALTGAIGGGIYGYANPGIAASTPAAAATTTESLYSLPSTGSLGAQVPSATSAASGGLGLQLPSVGTVGSSAANVGITPAFDYSLTSGLASAGGLGLEAPNPAFSAAGVSNAINTGAPIDYSLGAYNPSSIGLRAPDPSYGAASVSNAIANGTPIDYSLGAGNPPSLGLQLPPSAAPAAVPNEYSLASSFAPPTSGVQVPPVVPSQPISTLTPPVETSGGFMDSLKQVPGKLLDKFTSPDTLADMTLRAAGQLAGTAFAGDGLTPEEKRLLDAQTEELRTLQQTNRALFDQRLEQAQNLIGESKYFDPEYFGLQRARRAQIAGAKAKRAGLRGLNDAQRIAEGRRFDLGTARDVGSAFDTGYGTGVTGRLQTIQAGIGSMPPAMGDSFGGFNSLRSAYGNAEDRRTREVTGIQRLFGDITGTAQANSRG